MRIINELVNYLRARGLLTVRDLLDLGEARLIEPQNAWSARSARQPRRDLSEHPGEHADVDRGRLWEPMNPEERPLADPELEDDEAHPALRGARRRAGGGRAPQRATFKLPALAARLEAERADVLDRLRPLAALAPSGGEAEPTPEVLAELGAASLEALALRLARVYDARPARLGELWDALAVDLGVLEPALRGPAVNAFRALAADDAPTFPAHGRWIMARPAVAWTVHALRARRRLLKAHGAMLDLQPQSLARALARSGDTLAYWTLAHLVTARAATGEVASLEPLQAVHPAREAAGLSLPARLPLTLACVVDTARVLGLVRTAEQSGTVPDHFGYATVAPAAWHAGLEKRPTLHPGR